MRPLIESRDMKISNLLAASACAGLLTACDSPRPEEDPDLYRATVDFTSRRAPLQDIQDAPQKLYYQTLEFDMTVITHDDGARSHIGMLGCVMVQTEITDEDRKLNRPIQVSFIDQETRETITGTIQASNLSRAEWMRAEHCHAWAVPENGGDIPAAQPPRYQERNFNQLGNAPLASPI